MGGEEPAEAGNGKEKFDGASIRRITLEGCRQVPAKQVRAALRQEKAPWWKRRAEEARFDGFWAEEDRRRIAAFYRSRGFYGTEVFPPEVEWKDGRRRGVVVRYRVSEGVPVRVESVRWVFEDGEPSPEEMEDLRGLAEIRAGDRFETPAYQRTGHAAEAYYRDKGHFHASVTRRAEVNLDERSAKVVYEVSRGDVYRAGAVTVEGTLATRPRAVEKALDLKEGETYSRSGVIENQRRVSRLPIYSSAHIRETADEEKGEVRFTVRVEEGKPRRLQVGAGYGSEEEVRVRLAWGHVNVGGMAEEFTLSTRWSALLEAEEARLARPNVFRAGDVLQISGERRVQREESYTHEALALMPSYRVLLSRRLTGEISYRVERSHVKAFLDAASVDEDDLAREGLLSAAIGRLDWIATDDPVEPSRGWRAGLFGEVGLGLLGGDFRYRRFVADARAYWPALSRVVLAVRGRAGWAAPSGGLDRIPIFKRFFTGGASSVRGFDRYRLGPLDADGKPIGGAKMWEGSTEARFTFTKTWGAVAFVDNGWTWLEEESVSASDVVFSAGAGLRIRTPLGPIALDAAFPLESGPAYPKYRIHLNIGHAF
jgi:outer membrane protein assembly complex protein YaeT